MAEVTRGEALEVLRRELGIQDVGGIPRVITKAVTPVYSVNATISTHAISLDSAASGNSSFTIDRDGYDFYIVALQLSYTADAVCDCDAVDINHQETDRLCILGVQPTTAQSHQIERTFPYPFRIRHGDTVELRGVKGAGTFEKYGVLIGFYLPSA